MNTNHPIQIQLNDGKTILANWAEAFAKVPTVGETINISQPLDGYRNQAVVSKVEIDAKTTTTTLILDALPAAVKRHRPVIFLNEDYIPAALRQDVEDHLKRRFSLPVFDWVRSLRATPITEIHHPGNFSQTELKQLKNEIRDLILRASDLVVR